MVSPGTAIGGLSLLLSLSDRRKRRQMEQQASNPEADPDDVGMPFEARKQNEIAEDQSRTADQLERLVEMEERNQPGPEDKDAYSSATITLSDGETATVTVEPSEGFNLRVKRIHFDKRNDHDYTLNVGGDITSVSHVAKYVKPKLVSQSDRVIAEVTNNSGSSTVIDFEMEAWAEPPGSN